MSRIINVCLCDDDKIFTMLTKAVIANAGQETAIQTFLNGSDLIDFVKEELATQRPLPDVIFLDLNMPIMDGWEFLDEFEGLEVPKVPEIYILSSTSFQGDISRAGKYSSVKGFVTKPLTKDRVREIFQL